MSSITPRPRTAPVVLATFALLITSLATGLFPAAAAAKRPNLVVAQATVDRTTLAEGDKLSVTHVVRNGGVVKAGGSHTRFYLTRDVAASLAERAASRTNPRSAAGDIRLVGQVSVKALDPGKKARLDKVELTVPIGTQPGKYSVLACADDRGKVKEADEADNCTVAGEPLTVKAPAGNEDLVVQQFADTARWPDESDEEFTLMWLKNMCKNPVAPKKLTLGAALASTRQFIESQVGSQDMQSLATSGQADTALEAQQLAGVAAIEGVPGLALAALLRAHDLEPGNGGHLINAAALAVSVGLPNEALSFLDASVSRDLRFPAMGISQQAIGMVVRGQALLATGRVGGAESLFLAAKAAEPMLSEADAGLAQVEACKGNDARVMRYVRKSQQRSDEKDTTGPGEEIVRPEPVIDRSFGKESFLRQLPMADTPSQGVDMHPVYQGIQNGFQGELMGQIDERNQLEQHLRDTDEARTDAEKQRRDDILSLVYGVTAEPDIEAMQQKIFDKIDVLTLHNEEFWGGGTGEVPHTYRELAEAADAFCAGSEEDYDSCWIAEMNRTCIPELIGEHSEWRVMISQLQNLSNEYFAEVSKRMSAYASNLLDEEAHRLALLTIEEQERAVYALIVQQAFFWTHYEQLFQDECVDWQPIPTEDPEGPQGAQSNGPCPKAIAAMNLVAVLGPTKVKVNCEKVSQEISHEVLPLLHAFGELQYSFQNGRVTVFIGSKLEGKLGVVEGGFKSGVYLTMERNGDLYDVGWRVGPGASVVGGAAEFQPYEDLQDISFIGRNTTSP